MADLHMYITLLKLQHLLLAMAWLVVGSRPEGSSPHKHFLAAMTSAVPLIIGSCSLLHSQLTVQQPYSRRMDVTGCLIMHLAGKQLTYGGNDLYRRRGRCASGGCRGSSCRCLGSRALVCQLQSITALQHLDLHATHRLVTHCTYTSKAWTVYVGSMPACCAAQPRECNC